MKFISIRHKLAFAIGLFITLIVAVIATGTYHSFRKTTRQLILDQQYTLVSQLARGLDDDLKQAQQALINVANVLPPDIISNTGAMQNWLAGKPALHVYFSHSLIVLDREGTLVASFRCGQTCMGNHSPRVIITKTASAAANRTFPCHL